MKQPRPTKLPVSAMYHLMMLIQQARGKLSKVSFGLSSPQRRSLDQLTLRVFVTRRSDAWAFELTDRTCDQVISGWVWPMNEKGLPEVELWNIRELRQKTGRPYVSHCDRGFIN